MTREYRDRGGKLKSYSTSASERYKWMPKWFALLVLAYIIYEVVTGR